jgi:hypothetical protein
MTYYPTKEEIENWNKEINEQLQAIVRNVELVEEIAGMMHEQWAHWTNYFLSNLTIENLIRWKEQASTPYDKLSEEDKEKDRKWAMKYLKVLLIHGIEVKGLDELQKVKI